MENANRSRRRVWRTIKRQLKFKGMGCCGSTWQFKLSEISMREAEVEEEEEEEEEAHTQAQDQQEQAQDPMDQSPPPVGRMTLAMALEFDRHWLRASPRKDHRPPLMRLLEETDGRDHSTIKWYNDSGVDGLCCVCMERNKDAAFISCGHTYCRPCATQLWINRGACPLCNRPIDDILYIY